MASDYQRWRNIREFLDDLPKEHCPAKPDHDFCTVCMRINYIVAGDCPLFHQRPKKKRRLTPAPPEARPEPIKDHLSADDVKNALKGEDYPIIEFAGPRGTGGHDKDEEIFEVKPIDVKPIAAPPTEAMKKAPKKMGKEGPKEEGQRAADTKPATAVADRDPESIVQEIMEELEFPDDELAEEEFEDEKEPEKGKKEPEKGEGDGPLEEEGGQEEGPVKEGDGEAKPPVVQKEAVKKRRLKEK